MKCLLASLLALLFFTNANALTTPKCHVKPKKKVCINDPINDWIFGGLNTLSELDYTKVCMWHKGSKIVFEMEARNPGLSGFSSNPRYYDLYILSPKMGGFIGFDFHENLILDPVDGWHAPCLVEAVAPDGGLADVESVAHYAHDGEDHYDFNWAHLYDMKFRAKRTEGRDTLKFIIPKKDICPGGKCHFKFTATSSEHSDDLDDDRVATKEVCFE
ncbi:MAG: hypothetical protein CME70_23790 [Halobacteriovorax sp.]|nr:hypothetical protein [Halobacteriovorax sp.]|tara:strand:- start:75013 stop:75660 length:648 start_codon:yes stop_codon:yes gene_type:complete